jgi:small-conductance mechanosensitive channel
MEYWNKIQQTIDSLAGDPNSATAILTKALVAILIATLLWFVLRILLASLQKKGQQVEIIRDNQIIFRSLSKAVNLLLIFGTAIYISQLLGNQILQSGLQALLVVVLASPATRITIAVLKTIENRLIDKTETLVDDVIFDLLNRFAGVIIFVVAIILALDLVGINVMPFIAGAGILGIAIGFAAKDTLSNLIAGILLIIDRPFEVGDRIEVWTAPTGSATWGDVIDIGIRATKIKTTDNIVIIIPNNEIMKRDIINYTIISAKIRVRINIGISYDAELTQAKQIILDVADQIDWIAKDPKPKVVVRVFGESSVDLQLRVWIKNARKRMDTISEVTDRVKEAFDRHHIEIPYPKRDIVVRQHPTEPASHDQIK